MISYGYVQATVVTANGAALTVSESENADLFWAIRGGGSNFGVCTEFVLRLHPQRRTIFGGNVVFPAAVLDDLMKVLSEWWKTIKDHEGMHQILSRDPAGNVSEGDVDSTRAADNAIFRIALYFLCSITDQRKKGARTSRNFMTLVSEATGMSSIAINPSDQNPSSTGLAKYLLNH